MLVYQAYKYELKPTKRQLCLFQQCAGTARWAYNYGLGKKIEFYKLTGETRNLLAKDLPTIGKSLQI